MYRTAKVRLVSISAGNAIQMIVRSTVRDERSPKGLLRATGQNQGSLTWNRGSKPRRGAKPVFSTPYLHLARFGVLAVYKGGVQAGGTAHDQNPALHSFTS